MCRTGRGPGKQVGEWSGADGCGPVIPGLPSSNTDREPLLTSSCVFSFLSALLPGNPSSQHSLTSTPKNPLKINLSPTEGRLLCDLGETASVGQSDALMGRILSKVDGNVPQGLGNQQGGAREFQIAGINWDVRV